MITYNSLKDRSEECGWKKVCKEQVPTDKEQDCWGLITIAVALILSAFGIMGV